MIYGCPICISYFGTRKDFGEVIMFPHLFTAPVVRNDYVMSDITPGHLSRWSPIANGGQEGLTVPTVDRTVIRRLPTCVEEDILDDFITTAKPVIEIKTSSSKIECNIMS